MRHLRPSIRALAGFGLALVATAAAGIPTPRLHVDGAAIKDTSGNTVILRGVSMIHAGWPYAYGAGTTGANSTIKNFLKLTDTAQGWYTRIVRVPVADSVGTNQLFPLTGTTAQKDAWVASYLQPLVDSAKARGVYVIIDFHLVDSVIQRTSERCRGFWSYIAPKFADNTNVLYEVYNEPTYIATAGGYSNDSWTDYKDTAQAWVDLIRTYAPNTVVLVGGPNYSSVMGGTNTTDTLTGGNIVYVAHMYPQNDVTGTKSQMIAVLAKHPAFLSEWGYDTSSTAAIPTKGTTSSYAAPLRSWAATHGISWTAWCWSGSWGPTMWKSDSKPDSLTPFGAFAKSWLADTRDSGIPSGVYVPPSSGGTGSSDSGADSVVFNSFDMPYGQNPRQTDLAASLGSTAGGWWYVFKDDSGTTTTNGAGADVSGDTAALSAAVSGGALHIKMATSTSSMQYSYAGLQVNFTDTGTYFDLRKLTKLVLRIKGTVSNGSLRVYFMTRDVKAISWGNYGYNTTLDTGWSTLSIAAGDIEASAWSDAATKGWTWADSGAQYVDGLGFSVGAGVDADLWIDNISFHGIDSTTFLKPSATGLRVHASSLKGILSTTRTGDALNVRYGLSAPGRVEARLIDMQGRVISSEVAQNQVAGVHELSLPFATNRTAILQLRLGSTQMTKVVQPIR